jgi:hypothetical protein
MTISSILEPTPMPTSTPTQTPTPTHTPTPTPTQTPTPTHTPTPTPLPSETPYPTDTPAPTITPAYLIQTLDSNVLGAQDTALLETKFMAEGSTDSDKSEGLDLSKFLPIILIISGGLVLLIPLLLSIFKKNA